jgi:tetratricopeptide (TPR) repeat protein
MRTRLGESLASVERFDAPIEQATTASLEALQAYSLANERRSQGREREAIPLFERAVQLDPNFAMAYARLSVIYFNMGDFPESTEQSAKAYALRDRVSERERLYITGRYQTMHGDLDGQERTYQQWKETYRRDTIPRNNLAVLYSQRGDDEAAVREAVEANRLDPSNPFPYANLCASYIALNRLDEAQAITDKGLAVLPAYPPLHRCSYTVAYLRNDGAAMKRIEDNATDPDVRSEVDATKLRTRAAHGRVREMLAQLQEREDRARAEGPLAPYAELLSAAAADLLFLGDEADAARLTLKAASLTTATDAPWGVPAVLYLTGHEREASKLHKTLAAAFSGDYQWRRAWGPATDAAAAAVKKEYTSGADALGAVEPYLRAQPRLMLFRGQLLYAAGRYPESGDALQRAIDHRFTSEPSPVFPVATVWLARAKVKQGDVAAARRLYQDAIAFWKDADPDLPLLVAAKTEYAALK